MSKKKKPEEPRSWVVRIVATVIKDIICDDCTKEEAERNPFAYATDEMDIDTPDWEVRSVQENSE